MTKPKKKRNKVEQRKSPKHGSQKKKKSSTRPFEELPAIFSIKQTIGILAILLILLTSIVFWRYLSGKEIYIFEDIGSDTITLFYPKLEHSAIKNDGFEGTVKWSFYQGLGTPAFNSGLPSPFWFGPKIFKYFTDIAHQIPWNQSLRIIFGGIVFFFLAKSWNARNLAAVFGALAFAFSGYMIVGSSWYGHSNLIFNMVLIILGAELVISRSIWWLLPLALSYLVGPRMYFLTEFLIIYTIVRAFDLFNFDLKKTFKTGVNLLGFGLLFILFAGPKLGVRFFRFTNSPRVGGKVSYSDRLSDVPMFATNGAEHDGTAIMRLFSSDLLGTGDNFEGWRNYLEAPLFYCGLLTLLLIPQLFVFADRKRKILYGIFLGIWIWITTFPFFRFAFYKFVGNYYKSALSLFIPLSLIFLAVLAFNHLLKGRKPNLIVLGGSLALFLGLLFLPNDAIAEHVDQSVQLTVAGFLIGYTLLLSAIKFMKNPKWLFVAIIALFFVELGLFSYKSNNNRLSIPATEWNKRERHNDFSNEAIAYIKSQEQPPFYRVEKCFGSVKSGYNDGMVQGYFGTKSYESHNNKYYVRFLDETGVIDGSKEYNTRWLIGAAYTPVLHPLLSVKYYLSNPNSYQFVDYDLYEFKQKIDNIEVNESKYYLPMGLQYQQYIPFSAFSKLNNNQKRRALYQAIVIEDNDVSKFPNLKPFDVSKVGGKQKMLNAMVRLEENAMHTEYFNQDIFIGKVNMIDDGMLFFSIPFTQGWTAKIDGKKTDMNLAHIGFMGVPVEKGEHTIEIEYIPPFFLPGKIMFYLGLLIFVALLYFTKGKIPKTKLSNWA